MLTIAGGIILAVIILAFINPILSLITAIGGFLIGAVIFLVLIMLVIGMINSELAGEIFVPLLTITFVVSFIFWVIKNENKLDYVGAHIYCFFKFKFFRFSKQSKINYYKNLELEKSKIDKRKEEQEINAIQEQEAQELLEEKSNYNKRIKHFKKLLNELKELEKNINSEIFTFSYKEVSAKIKTKTPFDGRASSIEFSNQNELYSITATGSNFQFEKTGNKKDIMNWTIQEIGKILANLERGDD